MIPHNIESKQSSHRAGYATSGAVVRIEIYGARGPSRYRVTFGQSAHNLARGIVGAYVGTFATLAEISLHLQTI